MTITFIDSGVLVLAARGVEELSEQAISTITANDRELASSSLIKLEVLTKANYCRQTDEIEFYETFFGAVKYWADDIEKIIQDGYDMSCQYGLAAMDALHLAAAISVGAEEFITTEQPTKPMYRVTAIKVISLFES